MGSIQQYFELPFVKINLDFLCKACRLEKIININQIALTFND